MLCYVESYVECYAMLCYVEWTKVMQKLYLCKHPWSDLTVEIQESYNGSCDPLQFSGSGKWVIGVLN